MAEVVVLSLLNVLGTAKAEELVNRMGTMLFVKASKLSGLKGGIRITSQMLDRIRSYLRAADRVKHQDPGVAIWVDEVQDVVQAIEDILDDFMYSVRGGGEGLRNLFTRWIHMPGNLAASLRIAERLDEIRPRLEQVCSMQESVMSTILAAKQEGSTHPVASNHRGYSSLCRNEFLSADEHDIVGTQWYEDLLVRWMTDKLPACKDPRHMMIAVWGMGGLGKTTLVKKVYNNLRIKKKFDCSVWVSVSENYEPVEVLRSLAKRLSSGKVLEGIDQMEGRKLVLKIRSILQGKKRYMIVFDDVWTDRFWYEVCNRVFVEYTQGGRILLTTRHQNVALSLAPRNRVLQLQPLPDAEAWSLFCKKAFWQEKQQTCPRDLEDSARKIVGKCGGLPLAVVAIGRMMSLREKLALSWEHTYNTLGYEFSQDNIIKNVMILSFYDLPFYLKRCFLYCSIFPEDYLIKRKLLVRLWVAEGFIEPREGMTLEEVAEEYLRDLIFRSMLHVVKMNELGRVKACKLHDVIRELALDISKAEKLSMVLDKEKESIGHCNKVRRLSIQKHFVQVPQATDLSHLRSLLVFVHDNQTASCLSSGSLRFKLLRVLDLRGVPIQAVPEEVFNLFNLHYLSLRDTKVEYEEFPRSIKRLQYLQTLDLWKTQVKRLPSEVGKLKNLRHLLICHGNASMPIYELEAPEKLWKLKNLQTLKIIQAGNERMIRGIGKLTQLRTLSITNITPLNGPALCGSIEKAKRLLRLTVKAAPNCSLMLDELNLPPPYIQKLQLNGKLAKIPHWFESLQSLTHLYMFDSALPAGSTMEILASLPRLVFFGLVKAYKGDHLTFSARSFPSLRTLYIEDLPHLGSVKIIEGSLPALRKLYICKCTALKQAPFAEKLSSLQELCLQQPTEELKEKLEMICSHLSVKLKLI